MLEPELRKQVDALWDKFWSGGLANPLMAIDQLNYLIFLNRLEAGDDLAARRAHKRGEVFTSVFLMAEECRWSFWRHLPAEQMHAHMQTTVFPWMKELAPENHAFTSFMRDAAFLIPKPSLLVEAVAVLDNLRIADRNLDTLGDIYEYMLSKLGVAGQIGQFRTPRHLIRLLVALVDPKLGQTIIDPAAGTGGFLIAADQHIKASYTSSEFLAVDEDGALQGALADKLTVKQRRLLQNALIGFDFDPTMVRIAAMNMVLHGIDQPHVAYADALGKSFDHSPRAHVVLANPPFSGSIDVSDISDDFAIKTGKTELLFLELILDLLLPGGKAAIIVPDGVLFTRQRAFETVRERLVEQNRLEAVISFPTGVFRPYAGVKTSALVVTRGGHTDSVWMYDLRADGYSLDDKRLTVADNDIPHLLEMWGGRDASDRSFTVDVERLRQRGYELTPSAYIEREGAEIAYLDPRPLLDELDAAVGEVGDAVSVLREALG
jgi:type I restriction enzyme M protein